MSHAILATPADRADAGSPTSLEAAYRTIQRTARLRERGMATVEYALGVVIVIVLIGLIITAINTGTFKELLDQLISAIMGWIQEAFKVNLPIKR